MYNDDQLDVILRYIEDTFSKNIYIMSKTMAGFIYMIVLGVIVMITVLFYLYLQYKYKKSTRKYIQQISDKLNSIQYHEDMNTIINYHKLHDKKVLEQFKIDCTENRHCNINIAAKRVNAIFNITSIFSSLLGDDNINKCTIDSKYIHEYITYVVPMLEKTADSDISRISVLFWKRYNSSILDVRIYDQQEKQMKNKKIL
jgi:Ca2+/Na+ antiporter